MITFLRVGSSFVIVFVMGLALPNVNKLLMQAGHENMGIAFTFLAMVILGSGLFTYWKRFPPRETVA